jgi:hypothetical protein
VPTRGHRLQKVTEVIGPRLRELRGLPDGISPENVDLIFGEKIGDTVEALHRLVLKHLSCR